MECSASIRNLAKLLIICKWVIATVLFSAMPPQMILNPKCNGNLCPYCWWTNWNMNASHDFWTAGGCTVQDFNLADNFCFYFTSCFGESCKFVILRMIMQHSFVKCTWIAAQISSVSCPLYYHHLHHHNIVSSTNTHSSSANLSSSRQHQHHQLTMSHSSSAGMVASKCNDGSK